MEYFQFELAPNIDSKDKVIKINNNKVIEQALHKLYTIIQKEDDITGVGLNGRPYRYAELMNYQMIFTPEQPFIEINKDFKTYKKYVDNELAWYKSQDLSIKFHPGIGDNIIWQQCASKDDKQEINSNYGWCVFSKENYNQFEECVLKLQSSEQRYGREAILIYTRPSMHKDCCENGKHDMMCTVFDQFFIRKNRNGEDCLYMTHCMRSNDIRTGLIGSDLAWICFLYNYMYYRLLKDDRPLLKRPITWIATSLHIYDSWYSKLENLAKEKGWKK